VKKNEMRGRSKRNRAKKELVYNFGHRISMERIILEAITRVKEFYLSDLKGLSSENMDTHYLWK
jgi:hypothetical protein